MTDRVVKMMEIDTCDHCYHRAQFSDRCLHLDAFNRDLDKSYYPAIPEWCPLESRVTTCQEESNL